MKQSNIRAYLIALFSCLLGFYACQKPVAPVENPKYTNQLKLTWDTVTVQGIFYYKVIFEKDSSTWDPRYLDQPSLYKFFRKYGNSDAQLAGQRVFDPNPLHGGDSLFYVSGDHLDSVTVAKENFILDIVDNHDFSSLRYEAVAITNLSPLSWGPGYADGIIGDTSFSAAIPGSLPVRLSINSDQVFTVDNVVDVQLTFDTAGVTTIAYYRYSALIPVDSVGAVLKFSKLEVNKTDSVGKRNCLRRAGPAGLSRFPAYDTVFAKAAATDTTVKYVIGLIGQKNDVIVKDLFNTASVYYSLFSSISYDARTKRLTLHKKDTLLPGCGKKWVVVQRNRRDGKSTPLISDDIDIRPFNMSVQMDLADRQNFQFDETAGKQRICVLTDQIPIFVDTYGDTTFEPEAYLWIATRKGYSDFYTKLKGDFNNSYFKNPPPGLIWGDCIFETKPETANFSNTGQIRQALLRNFDYKKGFRVSPLSTPLAQNQDSPLVTSFGPISGMSNNFKRADTLSKAIISTMVQPGSILGYTESALNTFRLQTILDTSIATYTDSGLGWHDAVSFDDLGGSFRMRDYVAAHPAQFPADAASRPLANGIAEDFCMDLDGRLYQHPFRGLPNTAINIPGISQGVKEFVIIIYGRGKYFGEPRVSISKYCTIYSYVWDKIPPQFVWCCTEPTASSPPAPIFDPVQGPIYAPMCAANGCTNFASLSGVFDVYFSPLTTSFSYTSVRDKGFGRIKAIRLLFNFHGNYIGSDPLTGERSYLTPTIYYDYPQNEINSRQVKSPYYDAASKDNPKIIGESYGLPNVAFRGIDYSGWQKGTWDMWVETEDDLGNRGLAPHGKPDPSGTDGFQSVRQLEIK
jgi:hypothetical protein